MITQTSQSLFFIGHLAVAQKAFFVTSFLTSFDRIHSAPNANWTCNDGTLNVGDKNMQSIQAGWPTHLNHLHVHVYPKNRVCYRFVSDLRSYPFRPHLCSFEVVPRVKGIRKII